MSIRTFTIAVSFMTRYNHSLSPLLVQELTTFTTVVSNDRLFTIKIIIAKDIKLHLF